MLINLVPEFLATLSSDNPRSAYQKYLEAHSPILSAYWRNYVLDLESPHAEQVIDTALHADRLDLLALRDEVDLVRLTEEAVRRTEEVLQPDRPMDVVLMVGVGAANAGELVVDGRAIAFICVEHFTGRINPSTYGMGLAPGLIPHSTITFTFQARI